MIISGNAAISPWTTAPKHCSSYLGFSLHLLQTSLYSSSHLLLCCLPLQAAPPVLCPSSFPLCLSPDFSSFIPTSADNQEGQGQGTFVGCIAQRLCIMQCIMGKSLPQRGNIAQPKCPSTMVSIFCKDLVLLWQIICFLAHKKQAWASSCLLCGVKGGVQRTKARFYLRGSTAPRDTKWPDPFPPTAFWQREDCSNSHRLCSDIPSHQALGQVTSRL